MSEIWKDVVGYEGLYEVSNTGRVKALSRVVNAANQNGAFQFHKPERIIGGRVSKGYIRIALSVDTTRVDVMAHRLVAEAFIPNPNGFEEVNHINGDKSDNRVENLEWADHLRNMQHAAEELGLHGERKGAAKIRNSDIVDIRFLIGHGVGNKEIAALYGVHKNSIYGIRNGRKWKRVA